MYESTRITNFWNKILKQKRMVSLALLFFIVAGIVLPNFALGFSINPKTFLCVEKTDKQITYSTGEVEKVRVDITADQSTTLGITCAKYYVSYVFAGIGSLITTAGQFIAVSAGTLLNYTSGQLLKDPEGKWAITRAFNLSGEETFAGSVFLNMWQIVKEWANMLIILGLIGVALAFVLNLDQYKKLLVPLLAVALLVNFSVVFVGLIIDASNIITKTFVVGTENLSNINYGMNYNWNETLHEFPISTFSDSIQYFALSVIFFIIYILIALTLLMLAIIFIERYAILAILFILSPLAFALYAFPLPKAKELFGKWWSHFIKWCFVGVIGAFFLSLGTQMFNGLKNQIIVSSTGDPEGIGIKLGTVLFFALIVIIFLVIGMYITFKSAGWMSGIVITGAIATGAVVAGGLAKGVGRLTGGTLGAAGGAAGGTVKGIAGGLAEGLRGTIKGFREEGLKGGLKGAGRGLLDTVKRGGLGGLKGGARSGIRGLRGDSEITGAAKRAYSSTKEAIVGGLESAGLVGVGTQALLKQQRFNIDPERKKKLDLATPQQIKNLATGSAVTPTEISDKAYSIQKMAETGGMKDIPIAEKEKLTQYATASGISYDVFTKVDPRLTKLNKPKVEEEKRKLIGKIHAPTGIIYTKEDMTNTRSPVFEEMQKEAENTAIASRYKKSTVSEIKEFTPDVLNIDFAKNTTAARLKESIKDMSTDSINQIKSLIGEKDKVNGEIARAGHTAYKEALKAKSAGKKDLEDYYRTEAIALMKKRNELISEVLPRLK